MSSVVVHTHVEGAAHGAARDEKPYSLFMMSPERVLGLKRAAEPFSTYGESGEQRLAKTPKTTQKSRPEPEDDDEDEGMRYPLRSRTPLSQMKNLGLYIPPPARAAAAAAAAVPAKTTKATVSIPAPRLRVNTENDEPSSGGALPKPLTASLESAATAPLAALCRTAVSSWKRKEGEGLTKASSRSGSFSSSSRRGSRSRGGRGRSSSVRVVVVNRER